MTDKTKQGEQQEEPKQNLPPNVRYIHDAQIIYNNKMYEVRELTFPDVIGKTAWSMTICKLKPACQTRGHSQPDLVEFYTFLRGEGLVMLKNMAYFCKPPMCIAVLPDEWIKVVNVSATTDLIFQTYLNGRYKRPDVKR
jgi:mannose-6-phosphate isomerase-like protein (cupin superfamily)